MAHLHIPPPPIEALVSYCVEWLARNLRAKVTITVWKSEANHYTEEYDARGLQVGAGDTVMMDQTGTAYVQGQGPAATHEERMQRC